MKDDFEFKVKFFDINGEEGTIWVMKLGGGTVGKKYVGRWDVRINGSYGNTGTMEYTNGMPKTHFDVAREVYGWYLEDNEI